MLPGAGVACLLLKEGVVCGTLCRQEQNVHAHYDQKDLWGLFRQTGSISSGKCRSVFLKKNATIIIIIITRSSATAERQR